MIFWQYLGAGLRSSKLLPTPTSLTLSLSLQTRLHLIKDNFLSSDPEPVLNLVKR